MVNSYNGWPGLRTALGTTVIEPVPGVRLRVKAGDVATVLNWVAQRFHREVEPLTEGKDDWGWAYRAVRGSSSLSNHASGTAIDLNANQHPFRMPASKTMTPAQIAACRRIVKDSGGVIRWLESHDAMHFEINYMHRGGTPAAVKALAARIRGGSAPVTKAAASRPADTLTADGKMGPTTIAALQDRLRDVYRSSGLRGVKLTSDGKLGPDTVAGLQRALNYRLRLGWKDGRGIDGKLGPGTVKALQRYLGTTADGKLGPVTVRALQQRLINKTF